ncbi:OmpA family protein [Undibacterium sp. JH2W]|uniref:OmpA family protein n=1 Tax=Undibacterium sp. JH2W TaxID=3413037 RepID=UPI003BF2BB2E
MPKFFKFPILLLVIACLHASPAWADLGFPDYLKLPPQVVLNPDQALQAENVAEAEFAVDNAGATKLFKGKRFARWMTYKPAAGEPALGYYNGSEVRIYNAMQATLSKSGWQTVRADDNKARWTMRYQAGGKQAWAEVKMDAPQAQVWVELIESADAGAAFSIPKPGKQPEKFGVKDDIPYLLPWPGSKRIGEGRGEGPLDVAEPGKNQEAQLVGQAVETRNYQGPTTLSKLQFIGEYREALVKNGWTVIFPASAAAVRDYGMLVAHYTQDGRDIWARLNYEFTASLTISTTDVGKTDLGSAFAKDCHVPLYGVFFDFNKATLKPESDSVLGKVASLLKADAGIKAEVEGHTDNVGGDDYNLKLSDARAASVRNWLVQHGIDAARLTSKGYGKIRPVADNSTDIGRARNRRVELAKLGCRP